MKKLIIASIAAVVGLAVNAATVDWQYKITGAQGTEGYNSGYTAYLVNATAWDSATISADTFTDTSIVLDSAVFGNATGRTGNKSYTTLNASGAANSRAVNVAGLSNGETISVYYVLLNTNAEPNTYLVANSSAADVLTGHADTAEAALGTKTSMTAAAASSASWTTVGGSSPVPEPTSGLLMLLGMAGLALRRKRA